MRDSNLWQGTNSGSWIVAGVWVRGPNSGLSSRAVAGRKVELLSGARTLVCLIGLWFRIVAREVSAVGSHSNPNSCSNSGLSIIVVSPRSEASPTYPLFKYKLHKTTIPSFKASSIKGVRRHQALTGAFFSSASLVQPSCQLPAALFTIDRQRANRAPYR